MGEQGKWEFLGKSHWLYGLNVHKGKITHNPQFTVQQFCNKTLIFTAFTEKLENVQEVI